MNPLLPWNFKINFFRPVWQAQLKAEGTVARRGHTIGYAECAMAHPTARATGRTVHHLFTGRLVAENGKIKLLRESLNPVAVAQALLPGGVKDLPDPEEVIFSIPPDYRT